MADAVEEIERDGGNRAVKDLFAGAVGGIAQVLIEESERAERARDNQWVERALLRSLTSQPFDIVKVRLQTTSQYSGAADAASKILKNEGATAFYKGTLTPLIGIGACMRDAAHEEVYLTYSRYPQYYAAGAFAGIANTLMSSPIEHIRIRLQTQPHGAARLYNGPIDCVKKLCAHEGVLKGLYRGTGVTWLREAQAYGVWFTAFEFMMNQDAKRNGIERKEIPTWKIALYGGLAGEALWLGSYPFDVIKSKMQSDGFGAQQKYKSMRDTFAQTWRGEGMRGFWRGLGPTLLRAMPVSAGTFAT
ncbi:hypothetical protein KCU68_g266, partial [Aureobasidium melanogenum]